MAATGWVARRWFRRRAVAMVPLMLLVVAGTTATLVAIGAAERTSGAYREYFERAEVGDVVLNPSVYTTEVERVIRTLPGVERVTSHALFTTTLDDGAPRPQSEVEGSESSANPDMPVVWVHGSLDGRYADMDRPALRAGRLPAGPSEALVSTEVSDDRGLELGDVVPLAFWRAEADLPSTQTTSDRVVEPIGVERVEIVGIGAFSDEVLPDGLYPRGRMIVSPDIAARYACFPDVPPPGLSLDEVEYALVPADCARQYQYFSLDLADDAAGIPAALEAFLERTAEQNDAWYAEYGGVVANDEGPSYFLVPFDNWRERARVERSIRPTTAALGVLAASMAALTLALTGLAVARELRRGRMEQRHWWHLGMTTPERVGIVGAPTLAAVVVGIAASVFLAWLLSPIAPIGPVRSVEPSPARELTMPVITGALALAVALTVGIALLAFRDARRAGRSVEVGSRPTRALPRWIESVAAPAVTDGLRAASRVRSILLVASTAAGTTVVVAAVVFGASLSALVSSPHAYGWNWDVAVITGAGYGDLDLDAAVATLDERDDVETYSVLGFFNEASINGEPVLTVIGLERRSTIEFTLLEGRPPTAADEVALGTNTARDHGVGVGDEVTLSGRGVPQRRATVTGIVVFPALGPLFSDRVATGTGMLLSEAVAAPEETAGLASFLGVDLVDAADVDRVGAELLAEMRGWDSLAPPAIEYAAPVRPPEIIDASSMRTVPVAIIALGGAAICVGLAFALWASVRSRRRDLGVLRALGFSGPQVRRSVRVQAIVTVVAALAVGVPLGIIAGRSSWRAFAQEMGVAPDPAGAWVAIAAIVGGALVVAVVAAVVPARVAARSTPAAALRAE